MTSITIMIFLIISTDDNTGLKPRYKETIKTNAIKNMSLANPKYSGLPPRSLRRLPLVLFWRLLFLACAGVGQFRLRGPAERLIVPLLWRLDMVTRLPFTYFVVTILLNDICNTDTDET